MKIIFSNLTREKVNTYGAVLAAAGIPFKTEASKTGWRLKVHEADAADTYRAITQYHTENKESWSRPLGSDAGFFPSTTGLWAAALLLTVHLAVTFSGSERVYWRTFGASAQAIVNGELYRTVTALLLHAGAAHLAGNMAGIALFGTAVVGYAGWGVGWLLILLGGAAGNLLNAYFYQSGHTAIGASTAVFGAVGLLIPFRLLMTVEMPKNKAKNWLVVGSGLALLSMLGAGRMTDLLAHFFGFLCGLSIGIAYTRIVKEKAPYRVQAVCLLFTFLLLGFSWTSAAG